MAKLQRDRVQERVTAFSFRLHPNAVRCWNLGATQIFCLGTAPDQGGGPRTNWLIRGINESEIHQANPAILGRLGMLKGTLRLPVLNAPRPMFGQQVVRADGLVDTVSGLLRRHDAQGWSVEADGCVLNPGQAYVIGSADCTTVVFLKEDGTVATAHCGLQALIPMKEAKHLGAACNQHASVLKNLAAHGPFQAAAEFLGIRSGLTYDPNHLTYGEGNKNLLAYLDHYYGPWCVNMATGEVFLDKIIQRQLLDAPWGPKQNLIADASRLFWDGIDTGSETDRGYWASNRVDPNARNLIIVHVL